MNRVELVSAMAAMSGYTKKDLGNALDAFTTVVTETLAKGEDVKLAGFGTFCVTERAARVGRNPLTGESINIAASKSAKFKPSANLKAIVKGE